MDWTAYSAVFDPATVVSLLVGAVAAGLSAGAAVLAISLIYRR